MVTFVFAKQTAAVALTATAENLVSALAAAATLVAAAVARAVYDSSGGARDQGLRPSRLLSAFEIITLRRHYHER